MATVIDISHETGDLTQWTTTSGKVTVITGAAMGKTNYGLNIQIDDGTTDYAQKIIADNTSGKLRCRFYFDPNSLTMAQGNTFTIFYIYDSSVDAVITIVVNMDSGIYQLKFYYFTDAGAAAGAFHNITDATHYIEFYITRAATNVSSDEILDALEELEIVLLEDKLMLCELDEELELEEELDELSELFEELLLEVVYEDELEELHSRIKSSSRNGGRDELEEVVDDEL